MRQTATEAYEHQAYPFDRLVDDLALARDVTRTPLFDVVVVMQNVDAYTLVLDGVTVKPFVDDFGGSKFDLQFNFEERDGELRGSIVFNTDLFAEERIVRLIAHLADAARQHRGKSGARRWAGSNLLPPEERRRVLAAEEFPARRASGRGGARWRRLVRGPGGAHAARRRRDAPRTRRIGADLRGAERAGEPARARAARRLRRGTRRCWSGCYFERGRWTWSSASSAS